MTKPDISKLLARDSVQSASLRIIIPVGLTLVLFILSVFFLFIPSIEKQMMAQKREMIRNLTDISWSLLTVYHERVRSGELSLEDAQARVMELLRRLRYGPQGKDYFWISNMDTRMMMHPYHSAWPPCHRRYGRSWQVPKSEGKSEVRGLRTGVCYQPSRSTQYPVPSKQQEK